MAEIRVLPVRPHGPHQSDRLHADLAAAHARGETLGSRAPHIQASGERLLELSRAFEQAVGRLDRSLDDLGLQDPETGEALRHLLGAVRALADRAQHFPLGT
ncbi:hypothetical protein R1A27_09830 [Methylobacterium sp. NMS12]|uniref:hypothetical protein n=1 Tax=Methylobacterium sp. NMS12 TaxID=3079766 RepID=UPI003F885EB6